MTPAHPQIIRTLKPWIEVAFVTALSAALIALVVLAGGCAGTAGHVGVTLGPGDVITFGGDWSAPTKAASRFAKPIPGLPGYYLTNSQGKVSVSLTNRCTIVQ
jgi:hypothetical protein